MLREGDEIVLFFFLALIVVMITMTSCQTKGTSVANASMKQLADSIAAGQSMEKDFQYVRQ